MNNRSLPLLWRVALALSLAAGCTLGWAARTFPPNSLQVRITDVSDTTIIADGDVLHLAPGLVVFSPTNSTLVRGAIPAPAIVRVQLDLNGDVRRLWILTDDEILVRPWWQFWMRSQPQGAPTQPVPSN